MGSNEHFQDDRKRITEPTPPLPGLTAPVQDSPERHADQPIAPVEASPAGQFTPVPMAIPPRRQRLAWLLTLLHNPKAQLGAGIVLFFALVSLFAPLVAPGDPTEFVGMPNQAPSAEHFFGTDPQGKDVFRQTVWGGRGSLVVGFGSALLMTSIATALGMTAGYFRGRVDDALTFLMNLFLVLPGLPLLIVLSAYLKAGTLTVIMALAITGWAFNARIIRAQTLSLREKDFVAAAAVSGESSFSIIFIHMLPNIINIIVGGFIGAVGYGITAATALSFLGLTSTQEVTWGTNLFWAQNGGALLVGAWWSFVPSGLAVALVVFGLALINYGMDEVTNPRLRAERELHNVLKKAGIKRVRATPVAPRAH